VFELFEHILLVFNYELYNLIVCFYSVNTNHQPTSPVYRNISLVTSLIGQRTITCINRPLDEKTLDQQSP